MMFDGEKGRDYRSRFGIVGYVGANGSGKSLTAVHDSMPSLSAGRPVLSTVRLLDWENLRPCELSAAECGLPSHPDHMHPHPSWVPFWSWSDLLDAEHCDVLMDEVTGIASSRDAMSLPGPVANLLVQLRRRDVVLRWTAPSWRRADTIIRECTQLAVMCSGFLPRRLAGQTWRSNRVIKARAVDARELDDVTAQRGAKESALQVSWMRLEALEARRAYDTLDQVMSLPQVEGGRCAVCGGRRSIPKCTCDERDTLAGRERKRSEHASAERVPLPLVSPRRVADADTELLPVVS